MTKRRWWTTMGLLLMGVAAAFAMRPGQGFGTEVRRTAGA